MNKILITGGSGYIGSHTALKLAEYGYEPVLFDNLSNSNAAVLDRLEALLGRRPEFHIGDILVKEDLYKLFDQHEFEAVIHFAGCKAVAESVELPLKYYLNNVVGSVNVLDVMQQFGCKKFVFSSSCTVYGQAEAVPVFETSELTPLNPYGRSKLAVEEVLQDIVSSDDGWKISILRYFNPGGAHSSGLLSENPLGKPNNLLPFIAQVAAGRQEELLVFGGDYDTPDGTGIRDYIHVMDVADAHVKVIERQEKTLEIFNIGIGQGYSVLEIIRSFEEVNSLKIPFRIVSRRNGDVARCYANSNKIKRVLNWTPHFDLNDIMRDLWNARNAESI